MQCTGIRTSLPVRGPARNVVARSSAGKTDLKKQGLNKVKNASVKLNLVQAKALFAGKYGKVYQFEDKYGANVDGYSPIFTPDSWSESGESYDLGTKGLLAWAGLVVVLLGVGINLIVSTSNL